MTLPQSDERQVTRDKDGGIAGEGRGREQGRGKGICLRGIKNIMDMDREETRTAHRKMAVYRGKRANPC